MKLKKIFGESFRARTKGKRNGKLFYLFFNYKKFCFVGYKENLIDFAQFFRATKIQIFKNLKEKNQNKTLIYDDRFL